MTARRLTSAATPPVDLAFFYRMPQNYFRGKSQAWLEAQLAMAQADASAGKATTSITTSDLSTGKIIEVDADTRIRRLEWALYELDPIKWPLQRPNTRTRAIFS